MQHHLFTLMAVCVLSFGAQGQNRDSLITAGLSVQVDDTLIFIGGCPRDTMKVTRLEFDGRTVDPSSVEGKKYLQEREKGRYDEMVMETRNMDSLLVKMNNKLKTALPDVGSRAVYDREFDLWLRARESHCGPIREELNMDAQAAVLDCRRWITICRIGDMPAVYAKWVNPK
jgi:hypothetical protein